MNGRMIGHYNKVLLPQIGFGGRCELDRRRGRPHHPRPHAELTKGNIEKIYDGQQNRKKFEDKRSGNINSC